MSLELFSRIFVALGMDRRFGARGERVARRYLRRAGYALLASNLRNRFGEVDILAQAPDGRTIVVVEVKSGVKGNPPPEQHVNHPKERRLVALAGQLARRHRLTDRPIRFDVIGVEFDPAPAPGRGDPVIRHHVGAFESHV